MTGFHRFAMLAVAALMACPLIVASRLRPEGAGLGTHQQLGLPPCTMRALFNIRCPACGMTTSWSHLVRGDLLASLQTNPGGTGLGLVAIGMVLVLSYHALMGRVPRRAWAVTLAWLVASCIVVALADWGVRLSTGG